MAHTNEPCTRSSLNDLALKLQIAKAHELGVDVDDIRVDVHGSGVGRWATRWLSWQQKPPNLIEVLFDKRYQFHHVGGDLRPLEDSIWPNARYLG